MRCLSPASFLLIFSFALGVRRPASARFLLAALAGLVTVFGALAVRGMSRHGY